MGTAPSGEAENICRRCGVDCCGWETTWVPDMLTATLEKEQELQHRSGSYLYGTLL